MPTELQPIVDTTADDIGFSASFATDLRAEIHNAGVQATKEIFTEQILPQARALSPVGGHLDPHPGKNRDSIQVSFRDNPETGWISAWLYTESGYGWLIEHGTSHNRQLTKTAVSKRHGKVAASDRTRPQPYLLPAVLQFVAQIAERQREILEQGA
jgi:hypothetical protein